MAKPASRIRMHHSASSVSSAAIGKAGLLDESLFLYAEDTEWSLRARAAGRRHYVVPRSRVYHKVSVGSGGEDMPTPLYYALRNTLVVCERWAPLGRLGTWRRRAVVVAAHSAQALRSPRRRESLLAVRDGWRDFRRGHLHGPPGICSILSNSSWREHRGMTSTFALSHQFI